MACSTGLPTDFSLPIPGYVCSTEAHIMDSLCGTWLEKHSDNETQSNHSQDL